MKTQTDKETLAAKRSLAAHKANWTRKVRKLERALGELKDVKAQCDVALTACASICFASYNAKRHRGEYNLCDIIAAENLARVALIPTKAKKGGAR